MVACSDVVTWGTVLCVVLETSAVGGESVVCGVWALLCVCEVVWTTEVPVTAVVGLSELVVARMDVDWVGVMAADSERCAVDVLSVENGPFVLVVALVV